MNYLKHIVIKSHNMMNAAERRIEKLDCSLYDEKRRGQHSSELSNTRKLELQDQNSTSKDHKNKLADTNNDLKKRGLDVRASSSSSSYVPPSKRHKF